MADAGHPSGRRSAIFVFNHIHSKLIWMCRLLDVSLNCLYFDKLDLVSRDVNEYNLENSSALNITEKVIHAHMHELEGERHWIKWFSLVCNL